MLIQFLGLYQKENQFILVYYQLINFIKKYTNRYFFLYLLKIKYLIQFPKKWKQNLYKYLIIFIFATFLNAQNLKIASYNVENFFDLNYDKTEYNEYIPNNKSAWNQRNFNIKLENIVKIERIYR